MPMATTSSTTIDHNALVPIKDISEIDIVKADTQRWGEKEFKHYKNHRDFFMLEDGLVLMLPNAKGVKITSKIYEPDEDFSTGEYRTAKDIAPTKQELKRLFIEENMSNLTLPLSRCNDRPGCRLYISNPIRPNVDTRQIFTRNSEQIERWHDVEREITKSEYYLLRDWEERQQKVMMQRLERYWKRYEDKIEIRTYWVNR